MSVWIPEARRRLKEGTRNCPHATQTASGLILQQLINVPWTTFKNHADESGLGWLHPSSFVREPNLMNLKTQQNHQIHKTTPRDQYAFRQPGRCYRCACTYTHNANAHTQSCAGQAHAHLTYWLSSMLAFFSTSSMGRVKAYSLQPVLTKPLPSIYRLMSHNFTTTHYCA